MKSQTNALAVVALFLFVLVGLQIMAMATGIKRIEANEQEIISQLKQMNEALTKRITPALENR